MSDGAARRLPLIDRMLMPVLPNVVLSRALARERLVMLGYDAASPGLKRGSSGGLAKNAAAESWRVARDRVNLMWDARDMERNVCLVGGLLDRIVLYALGKVQYQSRTGDSTADKNYEQHFAGWARRADLTGRFNLLRCARLALRSTLRDGDIGWMWVNQGNTLRIQGIEADRIGSPIESTSEERYISGLTINEQGQVASYRVYARTRTGNYTNPREVAPEHFMHIADPKRYDQYRGITALASALPHARDLYELFGFEKVGAKFASAWAGFLRTRDPHNANGAAGWDTTTGGDDGRPTMAANPGMVTKLREGEEMMFAPGTQRPSGAFLNLVEALLHEIAIGMNLPFGFVYDMARFGGVTARLEAQQAQRTFEYWQQIIVDQMLDPIRDRVLATGIRNGELKAVPNWQSGTWQFGAHLTADIQHETSAAMEKLSYGMTTGSRVSYELSGEDFERLTEQNAREIQFLQRVATKYGVPIELLAAARAPNASQLLADMAASRKPPTPPPPGLINEVGDKAVGPMVEILTKYGEGTIDRATAVNALRKIYGFGALEAEMLVGQTQPGASNGAARLNGARVG